MIEDLVRHMAGVELRLDGLAQPEVGGWRAIAETTLAAPAASVTFAGIPQNYRTLAMVLQLCTDRVNELDVWGWQANADAGNNYDYLRMYMTGGNVHGVSVGRGVATIQSGYTEAVNSRANNLAPNLSFWPGYASASMEKWSVTSIASVGGNVSADSDLYLVFAAGHWRSTNAITSLTIYPVLGANLVAGSILTLYGIL